MRFAADLQKMVTSRVLYVQREVASLPLWPDASDAAVMGYKLDLFALRGKLRAEGRSSAAELHRSGLWRAWEDARGTCWLVVPRSLEHAQRDSRGKRVTKHLPRAPAPFPADMMPLIPDLLSPSKDLCGGALQAMGVHYRLVRGGPAPVRLCHRCHWASSRRVLAAPRPGKPQERPRTNSWQHHPKIRS